MLKWKRSPTTPQKLVRRAEIVLGAAEGLTNRTMSERGYLRSCRIHDGFG